ncbi:glycosyltransferase family 4 protein [Actinophytocola gossypii]|uniref:Undecaprenyl/decaprenyl-phosphate alpha-N-acetylglucosaminyl 1-phosphate transferase n=1 Tax=Actinophytocola gossypii TaxID=2812003 RepID=A0ABT2JC79_9PSEU|nr:MraY family glycosyltransferase [Actinophytocola gossypii]MCT2585070.1 undecaprenyl/decaprenyl-phosphate alpha-N-acetylglucosaminyl 1-phosphate transferase [Actinophytocola gossypii]
MSAPVNLAQSFEPAGLPIREYVLVGLTAAVLTFLFTGLVRRFALRWGAVAHPRQRDVHTVPIPRLGGLAMYLGVCGGMLLAHQLPVLRRGFEFTLDPTAVLIGGGVIMLIGMLDDRYELDSLTKLAGQTTCAGILVLFGLQWIVMWVPWGGGTQLVLDENQGALLTVLLVVTMVNAMNFVDGLDGLAAGIGLISAAAICAFSLHLLDETGGDVNNYAPALISATLAGACLGFLPHNFQPAKIFMGDSGSMLIGLMIAAASTSASGRVFNPQATETIALLSPLLVMAAVLFVPLLDLLMAVVRRTRKGLSPFHADKMHLHHRLLEIGHTQRRAVLLIYLWAALLAFGTVAFTLFDVLAVAWVMGFALLVALVVSAVPRLRSR